MNIYDESFHARSELRIKLRKKKTEQRLNRHRGLFRQGDRTTTVQCNVATAAVTQSTNAAETSSSSTAENTMTPPEALRRLHELCATKVYDASFHGHMLDCIESVRMFRQEYFGQNNATATQSTIRVAECIEAGMLQLLFYMLDLPNQHPGLGQFGEVAVLQAEAASCLKEISVAGHAKDIMQLQGTLTILERAITHSTFPAVREAATHCLTSLVYHSF